jgi:glucose/arabinose dehydrogenase
VAAENEERMHKPRRLSRLGGLLSSALSAVSDKATLPESATFGPNPTLPKPKKERIPTVHIATAKGWPEGAAPKAATGFQVAAYAAGFDHCRWLYVLPNGDVLVAETDQPAQPGLRVSLRGLAMKAVMNRAGSGLPSANRITLLRDADGDGIAEIRTTFLENLNSPFGMTLVGGRLYVANTDAVVSFPYEVGQTQITASGEKLVDLPAGPINHHWTKDIIASRDGTRLYVTTGSNSNVAESGMEVEVNRAAVLEVDRETGRFRIFASGLRNPNGLSWHPDTGELWVVVNERDEIGSDLVPDYMTSVKDGGFYGWPYSYFGQHVDERVKPQRPDLVAQAIAPDYALGNHTASLGLTFYAGDNFPPRYRHGAFIGQHGSWNRKPRSGYKVIFVPFENGKPSGPPEDILTGFVSESGEAWGRPVGVVVDTSGALLVADDVGNVVWRVSRSDHLRTVR